MVPVTQTDQPVRETLATELAEVEDRFAAELTSDLSCVNALVRHVERYRGKMLRPLLVLASGLASSLMRPESGNSGHLTDGHRTVATVVEMVHMATLVHDDILDEAEIRRQGATINHLKGNEAAVMLGDYLISHAYHLCSSMDDQAIARILAETTNTVCEGELLQLANRNNWQLDEATYLQIIRRKTASLCGTCCQLAAMLSGVRPQCADALYQYGESVGIAFQIVDDVLDLTGDPQTVGKTLGSDLYKGKPTLPVIHYLANAAPQQNDQLLEWLSSLLSGQGQAGTDQDRMAHVRECLVNSDSMRYASEQASHLIQRAKASLDELHDSPARSFLVEIADAVLTRKF